MLGARRGLEAALFSRYLAASGAADPDPRATLGAGLVRDGEGPRAFQTLVRYRGSVLAELFRSLAAIKLLQAGARRARAIGDRFGSPTKRTREMAADQAVG